MIDEIEELMQHWGDQFNRRGDEGGLGSPMATIMEWGGSAPRGTPGSRDLMMASGGGMDHAALEVAAALAELSGSLKKGCFSRSWRVIVICHGQRGRFDLSCHSSAWVMMPTGLIATGFTHCISRCW